MKIKFIGHSYHQSTKSSQFFIRIVESLGEMDYWWDESWIRAAAYAGLLGLVAIVAWRGDRRRDGPGHGCEQAEDGDGRDRRRSKEIGGHRDKAQAVAEGRRAQRVGDDDREHQHDQLDHPEGAYCDFHAT